MKSIPKLLVLGAAAVMAVAVSAAPSEAAKRKKVTKEKSLVPTSACTAGQSCVMASTGVRHYCGGGKWVAVLAPPCTGPTCGPKC
jgi:hypothetical protein